MLTPPYVIGGIVGVAGIILLVMLLTHQPATPSAKRPGPAYETEDVVEVTRETLAKAADLTTCRNALQQLNINSGKDAKVQPAFATPELRKLLKARMQLDDSEMDEVTSSNFTSLDAHYLEECFLFHDAARSLSVDDLPVDQQAASAFAWVVRQVRLRQAQTAAEPPLPPAFVLRRGWGTSLERALAFLAILRQLNLEGCLLAAPTPERSNPVLWGCGVARKESGTVDLLLFDPRLGLPLPAKQGKGIATLGELCSDPTPLKLLQVNNQLSYDVTQERLASSQLVLVPLLSSLSPRMQTLQKDILAPQVIVNLACDPEASLNLFTRVAEGKQGRAFPLRVEHGLSAVLRRFLPQEEGGIDSQRREINSKWTLVPLQKGPLADTFGILQRLPNDMAAYARSRLGGPFFGFYLMPKAPRDELLRGRYSNAFEVLTSSLEYLKTLEAQGQDLTELKSKLDTACNEAITAAGEMMFLKRESDPGRVQQAQEQYEKVKGTCIPLLAGFVELQTAEPLSVEFNYLLALCKHEQAESLQSRLDRARLLGKTPSPADSAAARSAWRDALSCWETYLTNYADKLAVAPAGSTARRLQARCFAVLGDNDQAIALLENLDSDLTDLEKIARLYQAEQLKKH
jgi:hypothetical protein